MAVDLQRLNRCLNPESIAVIGGKEAARVVEQCLKLGFEGPVWPVNPNRESMQGLPCFSSLESLPGTPDVTFIAIPAEPTIENIEKLNHDGAGGAICYSAGFREVGADGHSRHERFLDAAGTMPVFGPNCHGYINTLSGAALWPDQHGLVRNDSGVAVISSSGNVSINLTLQQRGVPLAWLITVGNQAVVGVEDGIAAALENEKITAIGIHIEGLNNLPLFIELAGKAREKRIPIIALKTGKSEIGARITMSHTATLAGENRLYSALFERLGIGQVNTLEEFLEALNLAAVTGVLTGNRISSMSCSGGEASLIADISVGRDLTFPKLEPGHKKNLQATLNEYVNVDNPLDYHTFIWGDQIRLTETFSAMMAQGFDLNLLIIDIPYVTGCDMSEWSMAIQAFIDASKRTASKCAVVASITESMNDEIRQMLVSNGVTPLHGMQQALAAIEANYKIGSSWSAGLPLPFIQLDEKGNRQKQDYSLDEHQAKLLLQRSGISIPRSILVTNKSSAHDAAGKIGYPIVLKAVSTSIVHKSELGAVVAGIASENQLDVETERLLKISDSLLVEEMITGTVAELLVGVSYDSQFGHYVIIGFGGTMVELINDSEIMLLPVVKVDANRALRSLKIWPLLNGFRGKMPADVDCVIDIVLSIAGLIEQMKDKIVELEINPLMVRAGKNGAIAADALVRMHH